MLCAKRGSRQSVDCPAQIVNVRFAQTIDGLSQAKTNVLYGKSVGLRYMYIAIFRLGILYYRFWSLSKENASRV